MESERNSPGNTLPVHDRALFALLFGVVVAVIAINVAPAPACTEGGSSAGQPYPYRWACYDPAHGMDALTTSEGALWADALIWGAVFGAIALAACAAWMRPHPPRDRAKTYEGAGPKG